MVAFLLTISFIIHFLTIYIIFILYKKLQTSNEAQESDIQTILDSYLQEIKKENKRLQHLLETKNNPPKREKKEPIKVANYSQSGITNYEPPQIEGQSDQIETSFHAKVLSLYEKGLGIDEIAKQLNRGKTETELILKFHKNN